LLVPAAALGAFAEASGEVAGYAGNAEEDQHGLGDGLRGDVQVGLEQAEPAGEYFEVEPVGQAEGDHLEHRVGCDQHGGGFAVAAGQVRSGSRLTCGILSEYAGIRERGWST